MPAENLIKIEEKFINAIQVIDFVLKRAVDKGATDIHYDPREDDILIRFRVDGRIENGIVMNKLLHEEVISRLKILSGARTDIHFEPQDGRFNQKDNFSQYHFRISFMPTYFGENAVIRILPTKKSLEFTFSTLGFISDNVKEIENSLKKTNGLILVTGPTGSGKTTTLNVCLVSKAKESLSIISLEDPVEYEIEGIRQIHVRSNMGVTFAKVLRSSLRQDPDVIMVGEIRDKETALVAVHTALTGHLVLSTLHTNSALEAIPRLLDMGVDHYLLATTLNMVIAQRLVRVLCDKCGGNGCEFCRKTGFRGRSIISEILNVDEEIKKMIYKKQLNKIEGYLSKIGWRNMLHDGLEKVEWGVTKKEEVLRVIYT